VNPSAPYVGVLSHATITVQPEIEKKYLGFRWLPMGENVQELGEQKEGKVYQFKMKNIEKTILNVLVMAKYPEKEIANLKQSVTAKPYQVKVNTLGPIGPKPRVWKKDGLIEVDKEIAVHQNIRMSLTVTPKPPANLRYQWSLNEDSHFAGGSTGSEVTLNRSQTGTCVATVVVSDADKNELGKGSGSFSVTISQQQLDKGKQKEKDQKKAKALLKESEKLWMQGKLEQAIKRITQAKKLLPKDKKVAKIYTKRNKEKKEIDKLLKDANRMIEKDQLKEAKKSIENAKKINQEYPKYKEILKKLQEALQREKIAKERKKLVAKLLKKAQLLWDSGKLGEAVNTLKEGKKKFSKDQSIAEKFLDMQKQKNEIDTNLAQAEQAIRRGSLPHAESLLKRSATISSKYTKYLAVLKMLKEREEELKKKEEEKKGKKIFEKCRMLWRGGALDQAVALISKIEKLLSSDKKVVKKIKMMKIKKKIMDRTLRKASSLIEGNKIIKAEKSLTIARKISRTYPKYVAMNKKLQAIKRKNQKKKMAQKVREIKERIQKAKRAREKRIAKILLDAKEEWKNDQNKHAIVKLNELLKILPTHKEAARLKNNWQSILKEKEKMALEAKIRKIQQEAEQQRKEREKAKKEAEEKRKKVELAAKIRKIQEMAEVERQKRNEAQRVKERKKAEAELLAKIHSVQIEERKKAAAAAKIEYRKRLREMQRLERIRQQAEQERQKREEAQRIEVQRRAALEREARERREREARIAREKRRNAEIAKEKKRQAFFYGTFNGYWQTNSGGISGRFSATISRNGEVRGKYSGDDSGQLSGRIDGSGNISMRSGGGNAGDKKCMV